MKFLLLSLTLLGAEFSYSQSKKFAFQLGEEYELPRKTEDLAFFGNEKDGIVNLSLKKEELNIVRFNPQNPVQDQGTTDRPGRHEELQQRTGRRF